MKKEQLELNFEPKNSEEEEIERRAEAWLEKESKKNPALTMDDAREIARISINTDKAAAKERERFPGGKDYEGRPED